MTFASLQQHASPRRVLVVADDAVSIAPVCAEIMRRGAAISRAVNTIEAAKAARAQHFDLVLIHVRPDTVSLLFLIPMLRAEAANAAHICLLVDPESAEAVSRSGATPDTLLSAALPAAHIADIVGLADARPDFHPPAVVRPARLQVLTLPAPLPSAMLPDDVAQVAQRGVMPDAVVITEPSGANLITAWMSAAAAAIVPVIDATGRCALTADAEIAAPTPHGIAAALAAIEPIRSRIGALPETYFRTEDARTMLVARLAVRERDCAPLRDPARTATVAYRDERVVPGLIPAAESLVRSGHLKRRFFDKLQCCPGCSSSRVLVREECSKCRSGDVQDEPVIHHLRCGYQGPERDFRQESRLVCPKCRNHLEHFSVDYDKPGRLFICNDCGQTTGDTSIGFTCLDCDEHHDTSAMQARTIYAYALTESGREAAFLAPVEARGGPAPQSDNPIRTELAAFVRERKRDAQSYAVLFIRLDPTGEARAAAGAKHWADTRALFASVLREIFSDRISIVEAGDNFLVLIQGTTADRVTIGLPDLRNELEKNLRYPVGARYDVLPPDLVERFA